jgi:hypothetical protein
MPVQTQILTRRGAAATWTSTNPTLGAGEIGFESDTNKFKIGTGSTAWVSLPYASNVSPLTTKGDLYTYSTDNARLAVGANGETLVADSSTSTGLRYTAGTVQANPILNSATQIWQRGTSIAVTSGTAQVYTADRWWYANAGSGMSGTVSRQATGDTTNLPFIQYCARVQRTAGNTSTLNQYFAQDIETINSIPFAGKTVTVSWYARKGADYSVTSDFLSYQVRTGTGTDQSMYSGYTGSTNLANANVTLTTTWQRFTVTVSVGSTATQLGLFFFTAPTGTAGANDYFEMTGIQIDIGSVALPFRTYAGTIQGELAACQRYYQKSYDIATAPGALTSTGANIGKTASNTVANLEQYGTSYLKVSMRAAPSVTIYGRSGGTGVVSNPVSGADLAANSASVAFVGQNSFMIFNDSGGTVTTERFSVMYHYVASAEL